MKKNAKTAKLALKPETVRALDQAEIADVRGAMGYVTGGWVCEKTSRGLSCWGPCATWMPTC
jgi:hypothetical protein